eukprot:5946015-Pleurochrysis_carterae.AAC.2
MVASCGDITSTWCLDLKACMAMARAPAAEGEASLTLHTYNPELRPKGSARRPPVAVGGKSMASVLPKRHSVDVDSQSWLIDSSESRKHGTHRMLR